MNKNPLHSLLGGIVYCKSLEGWEVSWENDGPYRHWCQMVEEGQTKRVLLILQNPGSLSGDGSGLDKDDTLRAIRKVFKETQFSPFIVNLFDFADPNGSGLIANWDHKDKASSPLIYDQLDLNSFAGKLFAYGNVENSLKSRLSEAKERIELIAKCLLSLTTIKPFLNNNGTPKHPRRWKIERRIEQL